MALLERPKVLAEIRDTEDPARQPIERRGSAIVANAVEELLRSLTVTHLGRRRVALKDIAVGSTAIRAGEAIIIAAEAANRAPEAFPEPDVLDIHRRARHHLAFGYGIHQCVGQALARVEMQVAFRTLFRLVPTLALAVGVDDLTVRHDNQIYGLHELPVTW